MKGIYGIRNIINGRVYIGATTNFKQRKAGHLKKLKNNTHESKELQKDYNEYGKEAFVIFLLKELNNEDNFLKEEDEYVLKLNALYPIGYNIILPSVINDCPLKKAAGLRNYYINNAPSNLKKITSEQWITNKKENPNFRLTKESTGENKTIVYRIDENTFEILETISSVAEVCEKYNIRDTTIGESLNRNKKKPYKFSKCWGHVFIRREDYNFPLLTPKPLKEERNWKKAPEDIIPYEQRNIRRDNISLRNINTGEIKEFKSKVKAANFLVVSQTKISSLIKGWENKGGGRISKMHQIKGWGIYPAA